MKRILPVDQPRSHAWWLPPLIILITMTTLAATIYFGVAQLRPGLRSQILNHDGAVLAAVARFEHDETEFVTDLTRRLETPAGQFAVALRLSQLKEGVLAARLFDGNGKFVVAAPAAVRETSLSQDELARLWRLEPVSRFVPAARLEDYFTLAAPAGSARPTTPLHLVIIPLHGPGKTNLLGAAQLILEGRSIAGEFARLDRHLWRQGIAAFVVSGSVLLLALTWAFRWLQRINRRLQEQASSLRRANQELALAAKSSALGTLTAHLVHGLTTPLTGLQNFVAARARDDAESQDALRSAERMQSLLSETVRLLSEEPGTSHYELPLAEMADVLEAKIRPLARAAGVVLEWNIEAAAALANRDANLTALILENLLRNAIEATPAGERVRLSIIAAEGGLLCRVEDQGPGVPATLQEDLFTPCRSTKPGGHGIGLAISKQLARHIGAELELVRNGSAGCTFALRIQTDRPVGEPPTPHSPAKAAPLVPGLPRSERTPACRT